MNDPSTNQPARRQPMRYLVRHLDVMRENLRRIDGALPTLPVSLADRKALAEVNQPAAESGSTSGATQPSA